MYRLIPEGASILLSLMIQKEPTEVCILMMIPINHLEQESLLKLKTINMKTTIMIALGMKWMEM